ncbi:MAG: hypothetical protein SPJ83_10650 [Helicobacter sp.]|uniref:hypothetical protein n=1 Tax=Helicobacter sp. TaxID=218 RepID=UPI002A91F076|nr:hypothetical protein [Helicobacter sp.]MDY5823225.1 hypothetical protein [Helicobacter sp.]
MLCYATNILSQYAYLPNDCIATNKDDGFAFYKGVDIAEAINNSLMDNTTFTSYPFLKRFLNAIQIFWQDKKILA